MNYTVFGVFEKHEDAEKAINSLETKGYNPRDISIIMRDQREGAQMGKQVTRGATSGVTTGVVVGGIAGLVASFIIPGIGAFFIGGPLATALGLSGATALTASGAATGALAGGVIGALTGFGLSDRDARMYAKRVNEGAVVVAVPALANEESSVEAILADSHADNIKSVVLGESSRQQTAGEEQQSYGYAGMKGGRAEETSGEGKGKNDKGNK